MVRNNTRLELTTLSKQCPSWTWLIGVCSYKRTTQNQEKKVSDMLNDTAAATTSKQVNVDLDEFSDTSSPADIEIHKLNTQDAEARIVYNNHVFTITGNI
ncbi:uncharacterized protein LOC144352351 isoform X3 [Saccoglossus kowalevskii]